MPRRLRFIPPEGSLVEVTTRTQQGRVLLRPSPRTYIGLQEARARELLAEQRNAEAAAAQKENQLRQEELARNRESFTRERTDAILAKRMDEAALRAAWKTRAQERRGAWEAARLEAERLKAFKAFQGAMHTPEKCQEQPAPDKAPPSQTEIAQDERLRRFEEFSHQMDEQGRKCGPELDREP